MSRTNIGISCFPKDGKKWVFIGKNVKMAENHEWIFRHFCGEGLILGREESLSLAIMIGFFHMMLH